MILINSKISMEIIMQIIMQITKCYHFLFIYLFNFLFPANVRSNVRSIKQEGEKCRSKKTRVLRKTYEETINEIIGSRINKINEET